MVPNRLDHSEVKDPALILEEDEEEEDIPPGAPGTPPHIRDLVLVLFLKRGTCTHTHLLCIVVCL